METYSKSWIRLSLGLVLLALCLIFNFRTEAQTWATNNPLTVARWQHTATLLNDGTVLITGGLLYNTNGNDANTNSCELYNPAIGISAPTASMQDARNSHTATLLPSGQVLVAGGPGSSSEVYDPPSASWTNYANMKDNREAFTATLLANGLVLVAGGYDAFGSGDLAAAETYDPATASWTSTGPMPYAMDTAAAARLQDGTVLVCGGSTPNSGSSTNAILFDPVSRTWTNTAPMNTARSGHAATILPNGKVLVAGGGDNSAEVYDPVAQSWNYVASLNDGRTYAQAVLLPTGQVMVKGDGNSNVELYDSTNDMWNYTDSLPIAGNFQTMTLLPGGQVVVTGGSVSYYNGPALAVVETYGSTVTNASLTVTASPQSGPAPLTVNFTSPGTDSQGNAVTNWNWDFGDGATSTAQSPTHVYSNGGFFSPSLVAYSTFGPAPLIVNGPAAITVTTPTLIVTNSPQFGLVPLTVHFTSPGTDGGGHTVTNWSWNFGDGALATNQSPTHIYTNIGTFHPSLVARSTFGSAPLTVIGPGSITVTNPILAVSFNPNSGDSPLAVQFNSPSADSVGDTVTNWNWSFGDGSSSTNQNPKHIYLAGGLFTPSLTAFSTSGSLPLAITGLGQITVTTPPNPYFRTVYNFKGSNDGVGPTAVIVAGNTIFGSSGLGNTGFGTVFALNTDGTSFTNLANFTEATGIDPSSPILVSNTLYGTTFLYGGQGGGSVYAVNTNGTGFTNVYNSFNGGFSGPGAEPLAGVVYSSNTLFGLTEFGGFYTHGALFAVNTDGSGFADLVSFDNPDGNNVNFYGLYPQSRLAFAGGSLYGTAEGGGANAAGTLFSVAATGTYRGSVSILHNFTAPTGPNSTNSDGAFPFDGVVVSNNVLYGVARYGGTTGNGVVYAVNTDGSGYTNLYNFTGGMDGYNPLGSLTISGNILYGSARGGATTNGTLFSLHTDGTGFTNFYYFTGGADGYNPGGGLFLAGNTLYGNASGGTLTNGLIFSYTLSAPPQLAISTAGTNAILSWSALATGYTLQSSLQIGPSASWSTVTPAPVIINGRNTVTNALSGAHKFYRLTQN